MLRSSGILTLLLFIGGCSQAPASDVPLTDAERLAIADSIRMRVNAFAALQNDHERLCEDPSEIEDFFTYPDGRILSVSDTTVLSETKAEWEARGLQAEYWCSVESIEIRIDSVVVQVLTRDVALVAWPHYFSRVWQGERYEAKGNIFGAWLRTGDGWRMSSGSDYYVEVDSR